MSYFKDKYRNVFYLDLEKLKKEKKIFWLAMEKLEEREERKRFIIIISNKAVSHLNEFNNWIEFVKDIDSPEKQKKFNQYQNESFRYFENIVTAYRVHKEKNKMANVCNDQLAEWETNIEEELGYLGIKWDEIAEENKNKLEIVDYLEKSGVIEKIEKKWEWNKETGIFDRVDVYTDYDFDFYYDYDYDYVYAYYKDYNDSGPTDERALEEFVLEYRYYIAAVIIILVIVIIIRKICVPFKKRK